MQTVNRTVTEYKTRRNQSYQAIADDMTAVLAKRPYPPQSITKQAIALWATDERAHPDAARLEFVRDNADDPELVELCSSLLEVISLVEAGSSQDAARLSQP
jgi:hypothetical protein